MTTLTTSGAAFYMLGTHAELTSVSGGRIPAAITLGVSYPIIDGKVVEVTATSGQKQYIGGVHLGMYSSDAERSAYWNELQQEHGVIGSDEDEE